MLSPVTAMSPPRPFSELLRPQILNSVVTMVQPSGAYKSQGSEFFLWRETCGAVLSFLLQLIIFQV
jgi:hypothetical protein